MPGRASLCGVPRNVMALPFVFPLTPFPTLVGLRIRGIYKPQTARGGIFLARRSAARLKNQAAGRGTIPLRARPARLILFFDLPVIAPTRRTAQAPARCLREKIVKGQLRFFKLLRFNKFVVVAFP